MFEVEKNVQMKRKPREKNAGIPFEKLAEAGDSFFVPESVVTNAAVKVAASRYGKQTGIKLSVQVEKDGCRVFRL